MSAIGSGGMNVGPLVGSVAGLSGQRRVADADRQQAEAAERKFQVDREALAERMVGDIGESGQTDERDADGRQPWVVLSRGGGGRHPADDSSGSSPVPDVDHERGCQIDLEA
uniref:Uncharacterized protein n=1 Tax=Schlesneria paludicola TaxID=360056 RepID=A0A7C4QQM2_9PLAN